jgi:hypothetical protein
MGTNGEVVEIPKELLTRWAESCLHMNHLGTLLKWEIQQKGSSGGGSRTHPEAERARAIDLAERARRRAWTLFNELLAHGATKPEGYQEPAQPNIATPEPE